MAAAVLLLATARQSLRTCRPVRDGVRSRIRRVRAGAARLGCAPRHHPGRYLGRSRHVPPRGLLRGRARPHPIPPTHGRSAWLGPSSAAVPSASSWPHSCRAGVVAAHALDAAPVRHGGRPGLGDHRRRCWRQLLAALSGRHRARPGPGCCDGCGARSRPPASPSARCWATPPPSRPPASSPRPSLRSAPRPPTSRWSATSPRTLDRVTPASSPSAIRRCWRPRT